MLRIDLLGPPRVTYGGAPVAIGSPRAAALLWFLAAQPQRRFTREELADLLWDGGVDFDGRMRLNTTLYRLRRRLPTWPIHVDRQAVGWGAGPEVVVDLTRFTALLDPVGGRDDADRYGRLLDAVALWRGPFLSGFDLAGAEGYEAWLRQERHHWEARVLDAWDAIIEMEAAQDDWAAVRRHAMAALRVDYWQERFHRWMMLGLWREGDRAAALAHFEQWQERLRGELEVDPTEETVALADAIRRDASPVRRQRPTAQAAPGAAGGGWRVGQLPARRGWEPPWVERHPAGGAVLEALQAAQGPSPRLVVVEGLAGMGKTRFLRHVCEAIAGGEIPQGRVAWACCYETTSGIPFMPWAALVRGSLDGAVLERLADPHRAALGWLVPEFRVAVGDREPDTHAPDRTRQLCEAMAQGWAAQGGRVVLAIDDMQWADSASWAVLTHLVAADLPQVTVLVSVRPDELGGEYRRLIGDWARDGVARCVPLAPFRQEEVRRLVAAVAPNARVEQADEVWRRTAGHPLFVSVLLQELAQQGPTAPPLGAVPADAIGLAVEAWLGRISAPARAMVDALAAFPAPPAFELLRRVAGLSEELALAAWHELLRRGIVQEARYADDRVLIYGRLGGVQTSLCHDLVREVAGRQLSQVAWHVLHRRILAELDEVAAGAWDAACLAYHAEQAGLWDDAARWAVQAAGAAEQAGGFAEAMRWLEQASDYLQRLPVTQDRRRRWVELRLRLALLAWHTAPRQAAQIVQRLEIDAVDEASGEQQVAWWTRRTEGLMIQGQLQRATQVLERIVPWAGRIGKPGVEGMVRLRLAQLHALAGDLRRAAVEFEASAPLLAQGGVALWHAQCLGTWASTLATLGRFAEAEAVLAALDAGADAARHPMVPVLGKLHALTVYTQQEAWPRAVDVGRRLLPALRAGDHDALEYIALIFLGLPVARLGDVEGGVGLLQRAVTLGSRLGFRILLDRAYAYLAEALRDAGRPDRAREAAAHGLRIAQRDGYHFGTAMNLRILHALAASEDEAVAGIEAARATFMTMGALPEVARCERLLSAVVQDPAERRRWADSAEAWYRRLGMPWS
ncbi:MAG: AAA family ATPase [Firmicutes bacterium]|nr:AAA family ATPase [Alicyclobacillaceae bacterium]MCL6497765.1 AAA family ATPase [Bacillota bacterium]